jgi:hypothetical protein
MRFNIKSMQHDGNPLPRNLGWQTLVSQVDQLLEASAPEQSDWINALLDFRFALMEGVSPRKLAASYCELRRTGEKHHYLDLFRMRRYLSRMIELVITAGRGYQQTSVMTDLRASTVAKMEQDAIALYVEDYPEWKALTPFFRITWKWKPAETAVEQDQGISL